MRQAEINVINSENLENNAVKVAQDSKVARLPSTFTSGEYSPLFNEVIQIHLIKDYGFFSLEVKAEHLILIFNLDTHIEFSEARKTKFQSLPKKNNLLYFNTQSGCLSLNKKKQDGILFILVGEFQYKDALVKKETLSITETLPYENTLLDHLIANLTHLNEIKGLKAKSILYEILGIQWEKYGQLNPGNLINPVNRIPAHHAEKIWEVKQILDKNLEANFTIQELALKVGTNEQYLKKHFKLLFGKTISEYKTQIKMEYSKLLLENKNTAVWEVAQKTGYNYSSHFIRVYKKYYGMSPKNTK